jgi:putative sterol carrier protein
MFSNSELNKRLYKPAAGYIIAPVLTTSYKKLFNVAPLKKKFEELDIAIKSDDKLREKASIVAPTCMSFKLTGTPEFSITIEPEGISLNEGRAIKPDVVIEGSLPLTSLMLNGDFGLEEMFRALISGKVRIKKGFRKILKIKKAIALLQSASKFKYS